jgi:hypothetical protein
MAKVISLCKIFVVLAMSERLDKRTWTTAAAMIMSAMMLVTRPALFNPTSEVIAFHVGCSNREYPRSDICEHRLCPDIRRCLLYLTRCQSWRQRTGPMLV